MQTSSKKYFDMQKGIPASIIHIKSAEKEREIERRFNARQSPAEYI